MEIALASEHPWRSAVAALGHEPTVVPSPWPDGTELTFDRRVEWGEAALQTLRGRPVELLLDTNGEALWLARDPSGRSDLAPVNDLLGAVHVSHFTLPIIEAFRGLPWGHLWNCLQSRSWIKACADAAQAAELAAFGVPNVAFLPDAAVDADYPPPREGDPAAPFSIGCLHVDHGPFFAAAGRVSSASLAPGVFARSTVRPDHRPTFYEVYFNEYALADRRAATGDTNESAQRAARYFSAKAFHTAQIGIAEHARFVRFLRVRFGKLVQLLGDPARPQDEGDTATRTERIAFHRAASINLGLNFNRAERGPDHRLFEIAAAGGFLLAHRSTQITDFLTEGRECAVFDHEGDLLEQIQTYLKAPDRRADIASAGRRRVLASHLLSHRLRDLLALPELQAARDAIRASATDAAFDSPATAGAPLTARGPAPGSDQTDAPAPRTQDVGPMGPTGDRAGRLLVLLNPGRMSRNWMIGMARGAERLGIQTRTLELSEAWEKRNTSPDAVAGALERVISKERIAAVVGYTYNGCAEFRRSRDANGHEETPLCRLGIPHLMFWSDHPQWANERAGLMPGLQDLLRHESHHHFVKSEAAADEIKAVLGWPHVYGLAPGEDTHRLRPAPRRRPEFDVVCVVGSPPAPLGEVERLLESDDPDVDAIHGWAAQCAAALLREAWDAHVPAERRVELDALAEQWVQAKRSDPLTSAYRHFVDLRRRHPDACDWLVDHPEVYFAALHALWEFGRWQRTFTLRYLSRFFRVGVFGRDWSSVGLGGGADWVGYDDQPDVYARGKVALSISQCGDEEGVAHKPFEITACGAPCVHVRRRGIEAIFTPDREIAVFDTPGQARQIIAELCADDARRFDLAEAGRARTVRDHSWSTRIGQMLSRMGLAPRVFGLTSWGDRAGEIERDAIRSPASVAAETRRGAGANTSPDETTDPAICGA